MLIGLGLPCTSDQLSADLAWLREQGLALGAAIVGSTLLALAAGAWAFVLVARLTGETDDG